MTSPHSDSLVAPPSASSSAGVIQSLLAARGPVNHQSAIGTSNTPPMHASISMLQQQRQHQQQQQQLHHQPNMMTSSPFGAANVSGFLHDLTTPIQSQQMVDFYHSSQGQQLIPQGQLEGQLAAAMTQERLDTGGHSVGGIARYDASPATSHLNALPPQPNYVSMATRTVATSEYDYIEKPANQLPFPVHSQYQQTQSEAVMTLSQGTDDGVTREQLVTLANS